MVRADIVGWLAGASGLWRELGNLHLRLLAQTSSFRLYPESVSLNEAIDDPAGGLDDWR